MKKSVLATGAILGLLLAGERGDGQAVTTGLVAYWPMDTIGATTPDTVGGHTFTNVASGATATTGFVAGGALHNGTDHFTAADAPALNFGTGSFTVAAWVQPAGTASVRLINKWVSAEQGWILDLHSTTGGGAQAGSLRFRMDSNAAGGTTDVDNIDYVVTNALPTTSNTWVHVAATVDRTANQLRLYSNGAAVGAVKTLPATLLTLSNTAVLGLGTIPAASGKHFAGVVDEVRLYNRALSAAEVLTLVAPAPPVMATPSVPGFGTVTVSWAAVPGATSYQVYYSTSPTGPWTAFGTGTTGTTQTVTGLTNGTTYYFVVTADNGYAESAYSNQVPGTPVIPPPRTNNHEEGLLGDQCACGSSVGSALPFLPALFSGILLLRRRR
jgi:hypothetical protein